MSHTAIPHRYRPASSAQKRTRSLPALAVITKFTSYGATLAGIYLSVGFLFYYAAHEKLIANGGTMLAGLAKAFQGSFFASIPGDIAA